MKIQRKVDAFPFWISFVGLVMLVGVLFFYQLGAYSLFDMDEPRYAEAAREMLEQGRWITPIFNYDLRFDKPVFFYWLIMAAYQVFGISEFSARFFSAVSASWIVLALFFFGRYWAGNRLGLLAALIAATSVEVIGLARMSVTDMTLAAWIVSTILCFFMVAHQSPRWWLGAGLFAGLAVLTKGPVGWVLPGGVLLTYSFLTGRFTQSFLNRWFPIGVLLSIAIALPWYLLAYWENGPIFLDALFLHNVNRFADVVSGHDQPPWFYSVVLLVGFFPWTVFLPASLRYWFQQGSSLLKDLREKEVNSAHLVVYSGVWTLLVFLFFSVAQTKLLTYILPLFPALALFLATTLHHVLSQKETTSFRSPAFLQVQKHWQWGAWVLLAITLIAGSLFALFPAHFLPREAKGMGSDPSILAVILVLTGGTAWMTWNAVKERWVLAVATQSVTMVLMMVLALQTVIPQINQATQGAMLSFLKQAGNNPLVTYEIRRPSLTYYARKKIMHVPRGDRATLSTLLKTHGRLWIITKNSFLKDLQATHTPETQLSLVQQGSRYSLLRLEKPMLSVKQP